MSGYSASAARETRSGALHAEDGGTLAQAAFRALRSDIIRGVRPPAERLRIEKLKTIYDIGPTPLREALQMLVAEELVLTEGNRGFTVAPLDFDEFADLNVARTAIELAALRLSLQNGDNEWEAGVVAAGYLMKKHDAALTLGKAGVPEEWERANAAFHTAIVAACGSKWLLHVRSLLHDQCERYRRASVDLKRHERDLAEEHRQIAAAVLERDADRASDLVAAHFERTTRFLVQVLGARD